MLSWQALTGVADGPGRARALRGRHGVRRAPAWPRSHGCAGCRSRLPAWAYTFPMAAASAAAISMAAARPQVTYDVVAVLLLSGTHRARARRGCTHPAGRRPPPDLRAGMSTVTTHTWPPDWKRVLVVVAHPDDESFALGALLDRFVQDGADVSMLCLTRGEASTLGADADDLAAVRADELAAAGAVLGMASTTALTHPDGGLAAVDPATLAADIDRHVEQTRPDGILVFDPASGVTGHPDHATASLAAIAAAERLGLPVLGWALPQTVADTLNAEYGAAFVGYPADALARGGRRPQAPADGDRLPRQPGRARQRAVAPPGAARRPRVPAHPRSDTLNPRRTAVTRRSTAALVLAAVVAATLATSGCSGSGDSTVAVSAGPTASAAPTTGAELGAAEFAAALKRPGTTIVDVRTPEEYAQGHLPGAVNVDVSSPDFSAQIATLDPSAPYAVYCRSGNRSGVAVATMAEQGFTNAYHLRRRHRRLAGRRWRGRHRT